MKNCIGGEASDKLKTKVLAACDGCKVLYTARICPLRFNSKTSLKEDTASNEAIEVVVSKVLTQSNKV